MRRAFRVLSALLVVAAWTLAVAPAGFAHDHRPPKTELHVEGHDETQSGKRYASRWVSCSQVGGRTGCVSESADGPVRFPAPLRVGSGLQRVAIVFEKRQRPDEIQITAYRRLDRQGEPEGAGEDVTFALMPVFRGGEVVAYRAEFLVDPRGDYYLDVFGKWRDKEGSDVMQDAAWTFAMTSRRPAMSCQGQDATIEGTRRDDVLRGTPRRDVIVARGGNDTRSRGGNDVVCAAGGRDNVRAGAGRDHLRGGAGADRLHGGSGRDKLGGNRGADRLDGGRGIDHCRGGEGRDVACRCERR